jgi:hypothetical protein
MGLKISELPAAAGAALAMQLEVNNAGTSQRLTLAQMFALSTGAVVADTPLLNFAQTWNNAAVAFTALKLNVTDTASAASLLMDLQVGGGTKFKVDKNGGIFMPAGNAITALNAGNLIISPSSGWPLQIASGGGLLLASSAAIRWSVFPETQLVSITTGVLEQRNSTNSQAFRLYNTFTDASNFERLALYYSSGSYRIEVQAAGTGVSNRGLTIVSSQVQLGSGDVRVLWGGDTGAFPSLKRNAAELQCRLADDSGYADLAVARLLTLGGRVCWPAASGASPDTPSTPDGYVEIEVGGTMKLIPFFTTT